jgi:hypothetical protein
MAWEHRRVERRRLRLQCTWKVLPPYRYQQWRLHVHAADDDDGDGGASQQWQQSRKVLAGCT